MSEDWSRWLDEALDDDDRAGGPAQPKASVLRLRSRRASQSDDPAEPRPILVVGGCGGAGTTTTVLGLAGERSAAEVSTLAVDATAAGGDLALRGADEHLSPISLQSWLYGRGDDEPAPLQECVSRASSGVGLLWRDAAPLRRRASYVTVARAVAQEGYTPVYDGGHPVAGLQLRPLLADADIALVLTIPARPDAANRLRVALEWLDDEFGGGLGREGSIVADTTIVVSHQLPDNGSEVVRHLRDHLAGWVHEVCEIPYDPHLAHGELVRRNELAAATRRAYRTLLATVAS